jgi:alcohol dehydrogenase class IV
MVPFTLESPRSIAFGEGIIRTLGSAAGAAGSRVLVLSGQRWLEASGWKHKIRAFLAGFPTEFACVPPGEPSTESLTTLREQVRRAAPQMIIAIGGGTVLDSAKALSVLLTVEDSVDGLLEGVEGSREVPGPGVPWVAVPTTAGTGAEVTKNAVVKSRRAGAKRSMRSVHLLASRVLVDPELTAGLPLQVTGTSGLDALTQLLEAYVSRRSVPPVRALIRSAFLPLLDSLNILAAGHEDRAARSDAAYGALVSGIALANAGLGAAHGFAAGIGGAYDIPHGLICAVFLPHVLAANAEVIREAAAELADGRQGGADPVEWLAGQARSLLAAFGLPGDLRAHGIPAERVPELARLSAGASMRGNPVDLTEEDKQRILARVI